MREITTGIHDWTTFHEGIGMPVHSHLVAASGTLIDPRVPEDGGLDAVAAIARPERIVLTNRLHGRHSEAFVEAFGCPVLVQALGLGHFADAPYEPQGFAVGDTLAPGIRAVSVGAITQEEVGLIIETDGDPVLALADVVIRRDDDGDLSFVPDSLLGDDPEEVRESMTGSLAEILATERFDGLLLAHGAPFATGGREALEAFVASQRAG